MEDILDVEAFDRIKDIEIEVLRDLVSIAGVDTLGDTIIERLVSGHKISGTFFTLPPQLPEADLRHNPGVKVLSHAPWRYFSQSSLQQLSRDDLTTDQTLSEDDDEAWNSSWFGL